MPTREPSQAIPARSQAARSRSDDLAHARRALLDLRTRRAELGRAEIRPVSRERMLPLSSAQQRLWFLNQLMPDRPIYNLPTILRVRGPLDAAALADALTVVVRRHEVLRTRYETDRGVPFQVVDPPPEQVDLPVIDLAADYVPDGEREDRAREHMTGLAREPFDLEHGPVLRALTVRLTDTDHMLGICVHHIATDGWSNGILIQELITTYRRRSPGPTSICLTCRCSTPTMRSGNVSSSPGTFSIGSSTTGGRAWQICRSWICPPTGRGRLS